MAYERIALIGAGNLAVHLGKALHNAGMDIIQVYSRTTEAAKKLASDIEAEPITDIKELDKSATIIIFALNDSALAGTLQNINSFDEKLLIHTSGSINIDIFKEYSGNYGVLYPLQTFSKFRPVNFWDIPVFLEANTKDNLGRIMKLTKLITSKVYLADSQQRQALHLSGIFMNNFVNYFYTCGLRISKDMGCHFGFDIFKPLITETANKAVDTGDPAKCQTGPAFRKNIEIIAKHSEVLHHSPELQNLYTFVSNSIGKFYHNEALI